MMPVKILVVTKARLAELRDALDHADDVHRRITALESAVDELREWRNALSGVVPATPGDAAVRSQ